MSNSNSLLMSLLFQMSHLGQSTLTPNSSRFAFMVVGFFLPCLECYPSILPEVLTSSYDTPNRSSEKYP